MHMLLYIAKLLAHVAGGSTIGVAEWHWAAWISVVCVFGARSLPLSGACGQFFWHAYIEAALRCTFRQVPLSPVAAKAAPGQSAASSK